MKPRQNASGFSLIELMVVVFIIMVIGTLSLPTVLRAQRVYRLNETTREVANLLTQTRYQAITLNRSNPPLSCRLGATGGRTIVYLDNNNNSAWDAGEPMVMIPSAIQFSTAGAPATATMNLGATTFPAGAISFNARGTVSFPVGVIPSTQVVILTYPTRPTFGYRAISITPVGRTKVWAADQGGTWRQK